MKKFINFFYFYQSLIYKVIVYIISCFIILYLFPKGGKFKYEFQKGKTWQEETLFAPFDFFILKSEEEIDEEKQKLLKEIKIYFLYDEEKFNEIIEDYTTRFPEYFSSADERSYDYGKELLTSFYKYGVVPLSYVHQGSQKAFLIKKNEYREFFVDSLYRPSDILNYLNSNIKTPYFFENKENYYKLFFDIIVPNVQKEEEKTAEVIQKDLASISPTRNLVRKGERIVAKNEVVEGDIYQKLLSLKNEFNSELWNKKNYYWIVLGYAMLIAVTLLMFLIFLRKNRNKIYENNKQVTFILINIIIMIGLTTAILKFNTNYIYAVPICLLPLILKDFFDARLAFFIHILTLLLLGFIVPNSFEYIFLQTTAGIVAISTASDLFKRANLFILAGRITLVYIIGYFSFEMIHEGEIDNKALTTSLFFIVNGLGLLFVQPIIYFYEKFFGLVSDMSLLELSDTNSKLLKELSTKAPGTFHHSLQVANLAEAAANEIDANAMLIRVAALYHDIGKMANPTFFTENQVGNISPHDDLTPYDSAKSIIDHVANGIKIAKRNNLPERVIDFIRTHHGTTKVYYFYKKAQEETPNKKIAESNFTYTGPKPFSKETAVLMMADAVEAASKSLKEPTAEIIKQFVNQIIDNQMKEKQFSESNITLVEIEKVKKILIKNLINIYHLRVEYPDL